MAVNNQHVDLNKLIGERIHRLMRQQWITHEQLADHLNVTRPQISKRLSGAIKWSAVEVAMTAAWLGVPIADIIPPPDGERSDDGVSVLVPIDELRRLPEGSVLVVAPGKKVGTNNNKAATNGDRPGISRGEPAL
jgi:transcriptional regulator with XRE-family HTH domain